MQSDPTPWFATIVIALLAVFAPVKAIVFTTGALVVADFVFGVWAARKKGERISAARASRTISKTLVYMAAVLASYLVEKFMLEDFAPASKIVAGIIGVVELKSIFESFNTILGRDLFASVVDRFSSANATRPPPIEPGATPTKEIP